MNVFYGVFLLEAFSFFFFNIYTSAFIHPLYSNVYECDSVSEQEIAIGEFQAWTDRQGEVGLEGGGYMTDPPVYMRERSNQIMDTKWLR